MINRRNFLQGSGAFAGISAMGLSGCTRPVSAPLAPLVTSTPAFRAAGPRQDVERLGDKYVVHNYGHGGSGWSLSWGSADVVVGKAVATLGEGSGQRNVAVIGAGALG